MAPLPPTTRAPRGGRPTRQSARTEAGGRHRGTVVGSERQRRRGTTTVQSGRRRARRAPRPRTGLTLARHRRRRPGWRVPARPQPRSTAIRCRTWSRSSPHAARMARPRWRRAGSRDSTLVRRMAGLTGRPRSSGARRRPPPMRSRPQRAPRRTGSLARRRSGRRTSTAGRAALLDRLGDCASRRRWHGQRQDAAPRSRGTVVCQARYQLPGRRGWLGVESVVDPTSDLAQ
jgi:hypothetical protein